MKEKIQNFMVFMIEISDDLIKENESNDQIVCDICLEDDDFEGDA